MKYRNIPRVHFHIHDYTVTFVDHVGNRNGTMTSWAVSLIVRLRKPLSRRLALQSRQSGYLFLSFSSPCFSLRFLLLSYFLRETLGLRFAFLERSKRLDSSHRREAPWPYPRVPRLHFHTGAARDAMPSSLPRRSDPRGFDSSLRWTATYQTRIHTAALRYPSGEPFSRSVSAGVMARSRSWDTLQRRRTWTSPSGFGILVTACYHQLFCLRPVHRSFTPISLVLVLSSFVLARAKRLQESFDARFQWAFVSRRHRDVSKHNT